MQQLPSVVLFPSIAGDVMHYVLTKSPIGNQTSGICEKGPGKPLYVAACHQVLDFLVH
ncbi:MAG: hypothetical protein CM1200mP40_10490 [Gammaproteobacteria bacterium]|nr:MAG: hypothetical protein CM1200mP40_10490 [Gammaproteobacteria bacterium]